MRNPSQRSCRGTVVALPLEQKQGSASSRLDTVPNPHKFCCSRPSILTLHARTLFLPCPGPFIPCLILSIWDELQLRAQGHKQEMPRQFSGFATLALAFSMTNSSIGYSATFPYPLLAGGGPTVFFGLIVASVACSFISTFSPARIAET